MCVHPELTPPREFARLLGDSRSGCPPQSRVWPSVSKAQLNVSLITFFFKGGGFVQQKRRVSSRQQMAMLPSSLSGIPRPPLCLQFGTDRNRIFLQCRSRPTQISACFSDTCSVTSLIKRTCRSIQARSPFDGLFFFFFWNPPHPHKLKFHLHPSCSSYTCYFEPLQTKHQNLQLTQFELLITLISEWEKRDGGKHRWKDRLAHCNWSGISAVRSELVGISGCLAAAVAPTDLIFIHIIFISKQR